MAIGIYPGSFDPPTRAHLAIARAALDQRGLTRVDLAVSRSALDKEHVIHPTLEQRIKVLKAIAVTRPWLGVVVTGHQLLVDISVGYDVLVMGADKYHQIHDAGYYDSVGHRDTSVAALPRLAVAARGTLTVPDHHLIEIAGDYEQMSSTGAREGRPDWMVAEARDYDDQTGAWTDVER